MVEITDIVFHTVMSPWLWSDTVFSLLPPGRRLASCLDTIHSFTAGVIQQRMRWPVGEREQLYKLFVPICLERSSCQHLLLTVIRRKLEQRSWHCLTC